MAEDSHEAAATTVGEQLWCSTQGGSTMCGVEGASSSGLTTGGGGGGDGQVSEALDPAYLSLFLLKYVCPKDGCFGTMAAVLGTDVCECNMCGCKRSEAEFLASLDQ